MRQSAAKNTHAKEISNDIIFESDIDISKSLPNVSTNDSFICYWNWKTFRSTICNEILLLITFQL